MLFSVTTCLYEWYQEKTQKDFEKKNNILGSKEIDRLAGGNDPDRAVGIFKSAVVSHEPIEGRPYYLKPPIAPLFYHDQFKRCQIADALSVLAGKLDEQRSRDALAVLEVLRGATSAGYAQVFAWNASGKWAGHMKGTLNPGASDVREAFGGPTASLLGALIFLDHLRLCGQPSIVEEILNDGKERVRYKVQKALLGYYMTRNYNFKGRDVWPASRDRDIQAFLAGGTRRGLMPHDYFYEGVKEIGLITRGERKSMHGTQHADIVGRLGKTAFDYVRAVGIYLKEYWQKN